VSPEAISSWEDLQREAPAILDRLNADTALGLAAAANPVLALEELGYRIEASARPQIEARLRFGPKLAPRVLKLVDQMHGQLGHPVDPDDDDAVRGAVAELGLTLPEPSRKERAGRAQRTPRARQRRPAPAPRLKRLRDEDLEPLRGAHPFIGTLLDYRKLAASAPRLAPRRSFDAIRTGQRAVPLTRVIGRLKEGTGPPEKTAGRLRRRPRREGGGG
jgi:hypothetical protein